MCVCVCAWVRGPSHHLPPKTPENSDLIVTGCVPVSTTVVRCVSHTKGILPRGCDVVRDYARDDAVTSSTVTPSPPPPPPLSLVSPGLVVLSFYSFFFFCLFFFRKSDGNRDRVCERVVFTFLAGESALLLPLYSFATDADERPRIPGRCLCCYLVASRTTHHIAVDGRC